MVAKSTPVTVSIAETTSQSGVSYLTLLQHVKERRRAELESEHPGRASNVNAVSNTTRSLSAFMEANSISEKDLVSEELVGTVEWDLSEKALGTDSTARRRKGELRARIRPWAKELIQGANTVYQNETFGERLTRLRTSSLLSRRDLALEIVNAGATPDTTKIRNWEQGAKLPHPHSRPDIERLEKLFDVYPGYLLETLPKVPVSAQSYETGLPASIQRRVSKHLPEDYMHRSLSEKDEILNWVSQNILSTPKEILEEGSSASSGVSLDLSVYALARKPSPRLIPAPTHLLNELDELVRFKTAAMVPYGKTRNEKWGPVSADKADYEFRAILGSLQQMGLPPELISLSICLSPEAIDRFIDWKRLRRGGYTKAIEIPLILLESLLHPKFGLIAQTPNFGQKLYHVPGLISEYTVDKVKECWSAACSDAKQHINQRIKNVVEASKKGRDPFEALLPVLTADSPLNEYYKIVQEIRLRMPDDSYPVRKAEALRSLMLLRIGLELGFRQKNLRELLLCSYDQKPRTWKELVRLKRGEISYENGSWKVRIPGCAFKNFYSRAVEEENVFYLEDRDHLFDEICAYIDARTLLIGSDSCVDEFFVKKATKRSKDASLSSAAYYEAYRSMITTYGILNPYTGRGAIEGLRPHGPHSIRHVLATAAVKCTGGYSDAAALLLDSEETIRGTYARFLPGQRHARAQSVLWSDLLVKRDTV
ncbi:helix-turn-helix domain-containing protein [Sulfitobacter pontiacus]|uniref:helix-turn-helix domain-containing protein n=1 Tax=Sulfitobacter pontiacus TaxID=60137 RepID=UPI000A8E2BD0|nr:helix-turn-helix transcriptional regulator [Sulfitobacter pontiacus]